MRGAVVSTVLRHYRESFSEVVTVTRHCLFFFFFNDTATTEIYTLSLHDALPISGRRGSLCLYGRTLSRGRHRRLGRSEEHTSELQSQSNLVCRLLLEKKKNKTPPHHETRNCQPLLPIRVSILRPRSRLARLHAPS